MKTLKLILPHLAVHPFLVKSMILAVLLAVGWYILPLILTIVDWQVGLLDPGVWQLLLFSIITFTVMLALCILLFKWCLSASGFPAFQTLVSQFKNLALWQQFVCYWASFALLLLAALLSLLAIF
ncbi:MAG: hypothetical protein EOP54_20610 [Sphingobacteriales bacterium]|nr:MAG: hypothetical protein EOP54_20610 [Sphingobacteriales bacterium]